jgi:hypothetical protein
MISFGSSLFHPILLRYHDLVTGDWGPACLGISADLLQVLYADLREHLAESFRGVDGVIEE